MSIEVEGFEFRGVGDSKEVHTKKETHTLPEPALEL